MNNVIDTTGLFVYKTLDGLNAEDCEFIEKAFHKYRGNKERLVLFFGEQPFKNDLTKIKQMVETNLRKCFQNYNKQENVDILQGDYVLYNMTIRHLNQREDHIGRCLFKNDDKICSCVHFVYCLSGNIKASVLDRDVLLDPGNLLLFPSSWVFPYCFDENSTLVEGYIYMPMQSI